MYEWDARDYQQHSQAQLKLGLELLHKLNLRGGEHVLDIGCGDGKLTAQISALKQGVTAVGIDNSEDMIRLARQTFLPAQHPSLDFRVMDASGLSFQEEFDAVFSNAALHWVKDHRPVLEGIRNSLKKGGRALLQMGGRGNVSEVYNAIVEVIGSGRWSGYFKSLEMPWGFYGPEEYRGWLAGAGLTPLRIELLHKDMAQPGHEGLVGWMRTTWIPFTSRLPEELRQDFLGQVADTYLLTHPADSDGNVHVNMIRLEVEAVKA
jgi:trans-aconitate 2-methyltransferase